MLTIQRKWQCIGLSVSLLKSKNPYSLQNLSYNRALCSASAQYKLSSEKLKLAVITALLVALLLR